MDSSFFSQQMAPWGPYFSHQRLWSSNAWSIHYSCNHPILSKKWLFLFLFSTFRTKTDTVQSGTFLVYRTPWPRLGRICITQISWIILIESTEYAYGRLKYSDIFLDLWILNREKIVNDEICADLQIVTITAWKGTPYTSSIITFWNRTKSSIL